tara:strand:- start:536 stop:781 length:246 start_codon:yes stop_codon:yes gene_type:complete
MDEFIISNKITTLRSFLKKHGHNKEAAMLNYISYADDAKTNADDIKKNLESLMNEGSSAEDAILLFMGEDPDNLNYDDKDE